MKTVFDAFDAYLKNLIAEAVREQLTGEAVALALGDGLQAKVIEAVKDALPQITDVVRDNLDVFGQVGEYMKRHFDASDILDDRSFKSGVEDMVNETVNNLNFEVKVT
jgi:hypothetical protein